MSNVDELTTNLYIDVKYIGHEQRKIHATKMCDCDITDVTLLVHFTCTLDMNKERYMRQKRVIVKKPT